MPIPFVFRNNSKSIDYYRDFMKCNRVGAYSYATIPKSELSYTIKLTVLYYIVNYTIPNSKLYYFTIPKSELNFVFHRKIYVN